MTFAPRLAATVLCAVAAGTGVTAPTPAGAALCGGATGVSVVVDFSGNPDGGGVTTSCAGSGGGQPASQVVPAAGYPFTAAQREPGFVCRVSGAPSTDPCQVASPTDAYWGLFWSDGRDGASHYATSGVGGTKVPAGGSLAFVWQDGGDRDTPPVAPPKQAPTPPPPATSSAPATSQPATGAGPGTATSSAPEATTAPALPGSSSPQLPPSSAAPPAPTPSATAPLPALSATAPVPSVTVPTTPIAEPTDAESSAAAAVPEGDLPNSDLASTGSSDGALPPWVMAAVLGALALISATVKVPAPRIAVRRPAARCRWPQQARPGIP